jgi:NADH-quinone oxidoreductase subunit M
MADLLVRGGEVLDGTGQPAVTADVRIRGGLIAEVGPNEFPAILAAYNPGPDLPVETFRTFMVVAAVGTVFAAGYLLWLFQRAAFGEPQPEFAHDGHITDVHLVEYVAWVPMIIGIIALGVYPNLIFRVTDDAVGAALSALGG